MSRLDKKKSLIRANPDSDKMPVAPPSARKIPLGRLVATRNALSKITADEALAALNRHGNGDWGDVGKDDWRINDAALRDGFRILSVYRAPSGTTIWVITEADRSATTLLLPEDY